MKLLALYAFSKYDKHLVDGLRENLAPIVDGYVEYDDTDNKDIWCHQGKNKAHLIASAQMAEADWVLCVDPDERFSRNAAGIINGLIRDSRNSNKIFHFPFREMWNKDQYRIDGIWGQKVKRILFPLKQSGQYFLNQRVHNEWYPQNPGYVHVPVPKVNLYHLKMIDPSKRYERMVTFKQWDKHRIQKNYDYLTDETNLILKDVPNEDKEQIKI